jgi:hypothetical protein
VVVIHVAVVVVVFVVVWNFFPVSFKQVLEKVESIQEFKEI